MQLSGAGRGGGGGRVGEGGGEGVAELPQTAAALWKKTHNRLRSRNHQPTSEQVRLFFVCLLHLSITPSS